MKSLGPGIVPWCAGALRQQIPAEDVPVMRTVPYIWLRADSYTEGGGGANALVEKYSAGKAWPIVGGGAVAIPAPVAIGAPVKLVTAVQMTKLSGGARARFQSSRPASDWAFITGEATVVSVWMKVNSPEGAVTGYILISNTGGGSGYQLSEVFATSTVFDSVSRPGGSAQLSSSLTGNPRFTAHRMRPAAGANPRMSVGLNTVAPLTASVTPAPQASASMQLGGDVSVPASWGFGGTWFESIFWQRCLSDAELAQIKAYVVSRYNAAASVGWGV